MFKQLQTILLIFLTIFNKVKSQGGESCTLQNGGRGKCLNIEVCPNAKKELKSGIKPVTCGFEGSIPLVCCDTFEPDVPKTKSEEFCTKYGKELYELQIYYVVGGEGTSVGEYPHMAALGFGSKENIKWQCGGSLISERFVLTAAHCLRHRELGEVNFVRMGDYKIDGPFMELNFWEREDKVVTAGTFTSLQDFEVKKSFRHPEYIPPVAYNDIGLIELNKPAHFDVYVKPACLHSKHSMPKSYVFFSHNPETDKLENLTATGWGLTQYAGNPSVTLQKVILQHFHQSQCAKSFRTTSERRLPKGILEDRQVCAGSHEEKDTCQGDSGGPLQYYMHNERLYGIVGITSFGKACGTPGVPSVYTRVSFYTPWIESIVWPKLEEKHIFQSPIIKKTE